MQDDSFQYHVFIVRVWREAGRQSQPGWRYTLEMPSTGIRLGTTNIQNLLMELERTLLQLGGNPADTACFDESDEPDDLPASDNHTAGAG